MVLRLSSPVRSDRPRIVLRRERLTQTIALAVLLGMAGFAIAGPSGLLAWSENRRLLEQRRAQIAALEVARDRLRNRVELLDADHADPDLVGELLREKLNVARPDEVIYTYR